MNVDEPLTMTYREYHTARPRATCRALVEQNGKFLLLFAPWCERWTLPGGGIDGFETAEKTMRRELKEELGISVKKITFLGFSHGRQRNVKTKMEYPKLHLIFHVKTKKRLHVDEKEAAKTQWVTLPAMRQIRNLEDGISDFLKRNPALKL